MSTEQPEWRYLASYDNLQNSYFKSHPTAVPGASKYMNKMAVRWHFMQGYFMPGLLEQRRACYLPDSVQAQCCPSLQTNQWHNLRTIKCDSTNRNLTAQNSRIYAHKLVVFGARQYHAQLDSEALYGWLFLESLWAKDIGWLHFST